MSTLSNNTKVLLYPENFLECNQSVSTDKCVIVQKYDYEVVRNLNAFGDAYGAGSGNLVNITVKIGTRDNLKVFYDRLSETFCTYVTLLFNVHSDDQGFITEYNHDGALVLKGYIVDINEQYGRTSTNREDEEITLTLQFLTSKMTIVGDTNNLSFDFKD